MEYQIPKYRCALVREGALELRVDDASAAHALLRRLTDDLPYEEVWVFYLNGRNDLTGAERVSQGGLHGAAVTAAEVFRGAIMANASAIIVGHNHPSGDATPSAQDVTLTRALCDAGAIIGVHVLDHVIVGSGTDSEASLRVTHGSVFR